MSARWSTCPGAAALLGRHVKRRPQQHPGAGAHGLGPLAQRRVRRQLGDAEVEDPHPLAPRVLRVRHQEDVVGLEVAVDDPLAVRGPHPGRELPADLHRRLRRQPLDPSKARRQALALEEVHDQVGGTVGQLTEVEDLDQGRVPQIGRGLGLVEKSCHQVRLLRVLGQQHLDGDPAPQLAGAWRRTPPPCPPRRSSPRRSSCRPGTPSVRVAAGEASSLTASS